VLFLVCDLKITRLERRQSAGVQAIPRKILIFETIDGRVPFREWMNRIKDQPVYERILSRLERVEDGNLGEHRPVGGGVGELVINFGPGYRVYYGLDGTDIVVLLAGGSKATQQKDINAAKKYWGQYNA
jgi:putative addiction module killer protein